MLCAQQIPVLLLDGICPNFTGVIKTQPAEFHKSFNKFDLPPQNGLYLLTPVSRATKSLFQIVKERQVHLSTQRPKTQTPTLTHSSTARWKHLNGQNLVDIHVFPKKYGELGVLGDVS